MTASNGAGSAMAVSASEQPRPRRNASPRPACACGATLSATNTRGMCGKCQSSRTCADCGVLVSALAERCRVHANAIYNADPANRARKSKTMRDNMANPAFRERHIAAARAGTARLMQQPGEREKRQEIGRTFGARNISATRSPEARARAGRAISARKLADIPNEYRTFYNELRRHGYTAAERRQMVDERVARDLADAAATVENNLTRQRLKAERDRAQAY